MALDHALIEELLSASVLRGLDPEDEQALARARTAHGTDCQECQRIQDECAEVAGRLAFALEPAMVPPGFEDRVVERAVGRRATATGRRGVGARGWARGLVAVAAAAALFAGGWFVRAATFGGSRPAEFLRGARVVSFQGTGGTVAIAYRPGTSGAYVFGAGLRSPQAGKTYELWRFHGDMPIPSGCFRPEPGGTVLQFVDASLAATKQLAITIESSSCPSAPTTTPILTADLTTA